MGNLNKVPFVVNVRKNQNMNSPSYAQYFPVAEQKPTLSLKGFARHLVEHGKRTDYSDCVLFLQSVVDCLVELLSQNQPVKLDGLGIFYPSITATKGGYATVQSLLDNLRESIKGVNFRFRPEAAGEEDEKLTSTAMKDRCVFQAGYFLTPVYGENHKYLGVKKTNLNAPVVPTPPEP